MPVNADFSLVRYEDGTLSIGIAPATNIAGWSIQCRIQRRFGGTSGLVTKSAASGYGGGASGITVTDSGNGRFNVALNSADMSGREFGAYAYTVERMDSGFRTVLTQGYLLLQPSYG